jgi:integrase
VARQVQRANGGDVEIRPPKFGSERTIYAPDGLLEVLSEHIRIHLVDGQGDVGDVPKWLFPCEGVNPLHQNSVGYLWRRARSAAGVDYRLDDCRHYYASGLIAAGCDVVTDQSALGHSSAAVTLKTYAHLWPDANDRTRKAAGDLLRRLSRLLRTHCGTRANK